MVFFFYIAIGALAGLLSGLFGVGGGIVVVPILATIFDHIGFPHNIVMHFAAGTSLAVMIITTASSLRAHVKLGANIRPLMTKLSLGLVVGTVSGGFIADNLHSQVLRIIFGVLLFIIAFRAFFVVEVEPTEHTPSWWVMMPVSFIIGNLSGLLGVGGGTLLVPYLLYLNIDMKLAIAVSTASSLLIAVVGTAVYMHTGANEIHQIKWTTGYIYWPAFLGIALSTPFFAHYGAQLAHRMPILFLRRLFSFVILVAAIKLLIY